MRNYRPRAVQLGTALLLTVNFACTSNPFGADNISSGRMQMSGQATLNDGGSAANAYVWLDGFATGTYTDADGAFNLTLPPKASQGGNGISGVYDLFFYIANYKLDKASVVVQNGEFLYERGALNKDGKLTPPKILYRFLKITTAVTPATIPASYTDQIDVAVTLQATDSATVVFPNSIGGLLGAILVRALDSSQIYTYEAVPGTTSKEVQIIGASPHTRTMKFNFLITPLPPGKYEAIPYLLVRHESIPQGLIASLGNGIEGLGPSYLKIPFVRQGGQFTVQ